MSHERRKILIQKINCLRHNRGCFGKTMASIILAAALAIGAMSFVSQHANSLSNNNSNEVVSSSADNSVIYEDQDVSIPEEILNYQDNDNPVIYEDQDVSIPKEILDDQDNQSPAIPDDQVACAPEESLNQQDYKSLVVVQNNAIDVEKYYSILASLPSGYIQAMIDNDVKIFLTPTNKEFKEKYDGVYNLEAGMDVIGLYDSDNKLMWFSTGNMPNLKAVLAKYDVSPDLISNYSDEQLNDIFHQFFFYHELGHVIDFLSGVISRSEAFTPILSSEFQTIRGTFFYHVCCTNHEAATSHSLEFFANAFAGYFMFPEDLKQYAPEAFEFMHQFYLSNQIYEIVIALK